MPPRESGHPGFLGSSGEVAPPPGLEADVFAAFCFLSLSVGPLHSDLEYTVSSQKEGYVLTAVEGTIGDFKAYALAGVSFEVNPAHSPKGVLCPCT